MTDPRGKRPLADDPAFLASLNDLDRGLELDDDVLPAPLPLRPAANPPRPRKTRPVAAPAAPPPQPPEPPAPADAWDPMLHLNTPPRAPTSSRPPVPPVRPLLDVFPVAGAPAERPPLPLRGTAPGPALRAMPGPRATAPPPAAPYETFYGLRENPFSSNTDPSFFFHATDHERALTEVLAGLRARQRVLIVTGDRGIGKTILCRTLLRDLDRRAVPSLILDPVADAESMLQRVLADFGVMSGEAASDGMRVGREGLATALQSFLGSLAPLHATGVVIVDQAEAQPPDAVAALLTVANANVSGALQVVLVGEPHLTMALKRPEMRGAAAGAPTYRLGPLTADEVPGYVMHRINVAGVSPRVDFDDAALQRVFDLSGGVPAAINRICERALTDGAARSASVIDARIVDAAARAAGVSPPATAAPVSRMTAIIGFLLLMLLGAGAATLVFHDQFTRLLDAWQNRPVNSRTR